MPYPSWMVRLSRRPTQGGRLAGGYEPIRSPVPAWGRSPCPALLACLSGSLSPGRPLPASTCQPRPGSYVLSLKCLMAPGPPSSAEGPLIGCSSLRMPSCPVDALARGLAKGTVGRSHVPTASPPSPSYHCKPGWHCPLSVPWGQVGTCRWCTKHGSVPWRNQEEDL